jgi:hypothetical protein
MTREELQKQIEYASSILREWPPWKRNILKHSSEPTLAMPREKITRPNPIETPAKPT